MNNRFIKIFFLFFIFGLMLIGCKEDQVKAEKAALSTAKYLWSFLSGIADKHNLQVAA